MKLEWNLLDSCPSTNQWLLEAWEAGRAEHGSICVAREQTAGRGQRGRSWWSAPGEGLALSLLWAPSSVPDPALTTMAAGLGVLDLCRAQGLQGASLKWPNDVQLGPAKLAGILVEARAQPTGRLGCVVGVGLNVAQTEFPEALTRERAVTSLALEKIPSSPTVLQEPLAEALVRRLTLAARDARALAADYLEATGLEGQRIEFEGPEGTDRAVLVDLSVDGPVELVLSEGTDRARRRVAAAHVRRLELL